MWMSKPPAFNFLWYWSARGAWLHVVEPMTAWWGHHDMYARVGMPSRERLGGAKFILLLKEYQLELLSLVVLGQCRLVMK
jgi:hypothetical protein